MTIEIKVDNIQILANDFNGINNFVIANRL